MKEYLSELNRIIIALEEKGQYKLAKKCNSVFMKLAAQDDENPIDQNLEDDEFDDSDYDPSAYDAVYTHPVRIFFNSETNQPIMYEGKMIGTHGSEEDYPELRGKVKAMTGVENITVVKIPADLRNVITIQTDEDTRRLDKIHQAHVDGVEHYPDFVYLILVNENTFNVEDKDMIFASQEDAESIANILRIGFENSDRDVDITTVPVAVSIVDSREEGLSIPELYGDSEFCYLEPSDAGIWDRPETIGDLESLLFYCKMAKKMTVDKLQELHSGKEEWELDDFYGDDMNDDNGGGRFSSIMNNLHKIASELENNNLFRQAAIVNDVFEKLAAKKKKKKSSGKNVPNDPSLWASCQAEAKRKFEIFPSAYANAFASRRYKEKGGTWRKAK